jgi:2-polyprenyl-3-methyl-5-hydroxy-6-metoxy-1,4-benzoquinol methylase
MAEFAGAVPAGSSMSVQTGEDRASQTATLSPDPTVAMFDEAAERGTRHVDALIATGTYKRATVLMEAIRRVALPAERILDYGCGAGRISRMIAAEGFTVVGLEPSVQLIRKSDEQDRTGLSLTFRQIKPGEVDGCVPQSFDVILCSSVIEFVPHPLDLLRKFHDLLTPDGRLLLSFANLSSLWRSYAKWRFGSRMPHFSHQLNVWRESDAWRLLQEAKFAKAGRTTYFESPFDAYPILRPLSSLSIGGTLGLVTARRTGN